MTRQALSREYRIFLLLSYNPTTEQDVVIVKHRRLAGRDGALLLFEGRVA